MIVMWPRFYISRLRIEIRHSGILYNFLRTFYPIIPYLMILGGALEFAIHIHIPWHLITYIATDSVRHDIVLLLYIYKFFGSPLHKRLITVR
jgi:hypothetical protein